MRPLLVALVLLAPLALAQAPTQSTAALAIDVQPDRTERMTLAFEGLKRLTRYDGICLPEGARETRVYDDVGDVQHEARDEDGRRVLSFLARSESVYVDMRRGAPGDAEHPLYAADANFCVPSGSRVRVDVRVPEGHTLFFLSDGGVIRDGRAGTSESEGPSHVFYSYEAPLDGRRPLHALDVAPFRVFVSAAHAPQAQEVARLAVAPYAAALQEAGLEPPFDALRVLYQAETPHSWEAGHYNGHGYVSVKEDTLGGEPSAGYPYSAVKVLVHEAFHAASFPYGKGPVEDAVSWWLEGTARHAERHVDDALPNATRHCERTAVEVTCWDFDDRPTRADLEAGYQPGFVFDARWEPSLPQSDETRRFYYAFSAFVVGAWIERHGEDAYRAAWDAVEAAFAEGEGCPCEDGWLVGVLDDPDLFRPWGDLRASDPARFEALVKPFLKDEEALERELAAQANPLSGLGVPAPAWVALAALAAAGAARRRR